MMRWTAWLWRAILNPLRYGCSHMDSRWGHVSLSCRRQSVQLGFGHLRGQKMFFMWLPMYWAYQNFKVCVIWAFVTFLFFQKWLESFWLMWVLDSHLSTYGNLSWVVRTSWLSWVFVTNV